VLQTRLEKNQTYIIAEIGINHCGNIDVALELIKAAHEAGADAVKFQKRVPCIAVPRDEWERPKETPWGIIPYIEYKERIEFGRSVYNVIDLTCKTLGIDWSASVWDRPSAEFMVQYKPPWIKIPSAKLTDRDLARAVVDLYPCVPIIISTGMSTEEEVEEAIDFYLSMVDPERLVVMHCTSTYPCPLKELNLYAIRDFYKRNYPELVIGYSGHETGLITTVCAVALGAQVVERHITLDRAMWGTDQAASVEPHGFRRLVKYIRDFEEARGDGRKRLYPSEEAVRKKLRGG